METMSQYSTYSMLLGEENVCLLVPILSQCCPNFVPLLYFCLLPQFVHAVCSQLHLHMYAAASSWKGRPGDKAG